MTDFNEKEKWIAITSVMKTSQASKMLSKDQRDQLFLKLHRSFAPHLKDNDIQDIEKEIMKLSRDIQGDIAQSVMGMLGDSDKKDAFDETEKLIGKEKTEEIKQKLQEINDENLK